MADRISNLATSNQLMSYLSKSQNRLMDLQYRMTSEKVSPDYKGISKSAQYLLGLESTRDNIAGYMKNNDIMNVRLDISSAAMDGIQTNVSEFKKSLKTFNGQSGKTQTNIKEIQQQAFNSLLSMQAYLNTSVGGRYVFAGGRTDTVPVDLNLTTLSDFQAAYDGATVTYPTTREANTENFSLNRDTTGKSNWLTFLQDGDGNAATTGSSTITSTSTGQFSNVSAGSTIEITGTASNNGTYTVASVDATGTTVTVNTRMLTNEANNAGASVTVGPNSANNVAQADKITMAGTIVAGDAYSVTINGITKTATDAGVGTLVALRDSLISQINADPAISPLVTASASGADGISLVSKAPGVPYTHAVATTDAGGAIANSIAISAVTANVTAAGSVLNSTNFTDLSFDRATNRMTVGAASLGTNALSTLTVGATITISGTAQNNGTYTVAAVAANGDTADIVPKKLTDEGTAATPTSTFTGAQTFAVVVGGDDTITAVAGAYSNVKAGMSITIAGATNAGNNTNFTVTSVAADGSSISVRETVIAETSGAGSTAIVSNADGTIASKSYYAGDDLTVTHRVDENRSLQFDLNGLDPAFEKAIRAMAIIAQGEFGTEGGLDQNISRVENSIYLLESAYDGTVAGTPPYGTEQTSSIRDLLITSGYQKVLLNQTTESHKTYTGFIEGQIANIENADPLETITQLLDDQRALEASYQTLARIRELSLINYM